MIINMSDATLMHHGILGQKWGIRRNLDGHSKPRSTSKQITTSSEKSHHQFQGISLSKTQVKNLVAISLGVAAIATIGVIALKKPMMAKQAANILESTVAKGVNHSIDLFPDEKLAYAAWSKNQGLLNHGIMSPKLLNLKDAEYSAGHIFYRLSSKAESSLKGQGIHDTYHVVDNLSDHTRYRNLVGQMGIPGLSPMSDSSATKFFSIKVKSAKSLKIAAPKTILEIARKKGYVIDTEYKATSIIRDKSFFNFPAIKKELIKLGYNGIVDADDFGSFAQMPIAFFKETIPEVSLLASIFE